MTDIPARIAENLASLRGRIATAAAHAGRSAESVTLVAVTKYVEDRHARALVEAGARHLGESRPQQLWKKAQALRDLEFSWHQIGHLQRNKVARTLPLVSLIHSVDSRRLLAEIEHCAASMQQPARVLLEVNISADSAKHGFAPEQLEPLLADVGNYPTVQVRGLMAMAAREGDARHDFARLRELRDSLLSRCPPGVALDELSMGMSGDFEEAIAEGATIVRVGSALFEGVDLDRA